MVNQNAAYAFEPSNQQINNAVNYLISHFNPDINLVYESELENPNTPLIERHPELEGYLYYNNTYWIHSDNLYAYLGLEPFSPYYANLIKNAYENLTLQVGFSDLFEVVKGQPISEQIKMPNVYYYGNISNCYIFYEKHNGTIFPDADQYADLCLFKALNYYIDGKTAYAKEWFEKAYAMFNGKGMNDKAKQENGYYANYKLALLLYVSKVL